MFNSIESSDVYNILKSKPIAEKLMIVGNNDIQGVFSRYVHDFVLFTCGLSQENDDTKVQFETITFPAYVQFAFVDS